MANESRLKFPTEILAVVIALVALFVSFRGCSTSDKALDISKSDYRASRTLVLAADFSEENKKVIFKPHSDQMELVTLSVLEPSNIIENGVEFTMPILFETTPIGEWSSLDGIKDTISKYHLEKDCKDKPGNMMIVTRIPVIVASSYIVKNTRLYDTSIYNIKYAFYREGDQNSKTTFSYVLFETLELISHIHPATADKIKKDLLAGKPLEISFKGEQKH